VIWPLSLQNVLFGLLATLLVAGLMGWWRSWLATRLGLPHRGEVEISPNPANALSAPSLIAGLLSGQGWIRQDWISSERLAQHRSKWLVWLLGSWLAFLPLTLLAHLLQRLASTQLGAGGDLGVTVAAFFSQVAATSLWFFLFNLIPLFPLDAFVLLAIYNPPLYQVLRSRGVMFELLPLLLALLGWVKNLLGPLHTDLLRLLHL
jgi:Zn-dependent protease